MKRVLMTVRNPETGFVTRAIVDEHEVETVARLLKEWRSPAVVTCEVIGSQSALAVPAGGLQ